MVHTDPGKSGKNHGKNITLENSWKYHGKMTSIWKNEILSPELPKLINFSKTIACGGQLGKIAIFIIFKLFLVLVYYYLAYITSSIYNKYKVMSIINILY